jgi:hypothetical protein
MGRLNTVLEKQYEAQSTIKREGNQIIIPEFMDYPDAVKALQRHMEEMEAPTAQHEELIGHPHDTLHAFYHGVKDVFGDLIGVEDTVQVFIFTMKVPGMSREIQVDYDEFMSVPYGKLEVPGLPVDIHAEVEEKRDKMQSILHVNFEYKKKYQPLVTMVTEAARKWLKDKSIFLGKAIDSQFKFINLDQAPLDKIVYSAREELQLDAELFNILRMRGDLVKAGRPVKRTVLFEGNYGTGKTLTALKVAVESHANGWTFMLVKPQDSIVTAIEFAQRYQPCVVFFEDVDQVTHGERDQDMNEVLNTIDGMLNKDAQVITVLTTNRVNRIEKAMIRPGRIDTMIEMGLIDEQAILGHIHAQLGKQVDGKLNTDALVTAADGYTPAFVVEALTKSHLYALQRTGDMKAKISSEDIEAALQNLRPQFDIMMGEQESDDKEIAQQYVSHIVDEVDKKTRKQVVELESKLDDRVLKSSE